MNDLMKLLEIINEIKKYVSFEGYENIVHLCDEVLIIALRKIKEELIKGE